MLLSAEHASEGVSRLLAHGDFLPHTGVRAVVFGGYLLSRQRGVTLRFYCSWPTVLALGLIGVFLPACSLDPNVRKHHYFQSGESYFEKGKYSEAAIEFSNAIKIDPDYTDAHFQLAQSYLNLRQSDRALPELNARWSYARITSRRDSR